MRLKPLARPVEDAECVICHRLFVRYTDALEKRRQALTCGRMACVDAVRSRFLNTAVKGVRPGELFKEQK